MKTVRLPIYEDGVELREYLEIDITFFVSSHRGLRNTQARVVEIPMSEGMRKVMDSIKAQEEIDTLDRIVHGLPQTPGNRMKAKHEAIIEALEADRPQVTYKKQRIAEDVPYVEEVGRPYHDWRKIPGFEGYTMNPRKIIINDATDQTVGQERGAQGAKVLLSDEDGVGRRFSVDFLFAKTFPELNK